MILNLVLLLIGFVILIKGADFLVDGSASIARKFNIPGIVIGLTIVAFGTSMPELVVNVLASIKNSSDLAVGNILGSNLSNILLILGSAAFIFPLKIQKNTVRTEIPFALISVVLFWALANGVFSQGLSPYMLSQTDGLVLLLFFVAFMYYTFTLAKNGNGNGEEDYKVYTGFESFLRLLFGFIGLVWGGQLIVDSSIFIAQTFGLSEFAIGVTVVAIGTSLPELATTVIAALKKQSDIAVGNVVGSNIFNILWILGVSSLIRPIPFNIVNNIDVLFVFVATFLLIPFMFVGRRNTLSKVEGTVFISLYIFYIFYQFIR